MIDTKEATELFEQLEREFADDRRLIAELEAELEKESRQLSALRGAIAAGSAVKALKVEPRRTGPVGMTLMRGLPSLRRMPS